MSNVLTIAAGKREKEFGRPCASRLEIQRKALPKKKRSSSNQDMNAEYESCGSGWFIQARGFTGVSTISPSVSSNVFR